MADTDETISERVRDVGDGLILGFPIETADVAGESIDSVRMYFFRVASETRYFQRYTQLSDITSGSTTPTNGYDYLGDTGVGSGSDIFRESTDDWHLMHFGYATSHPDLQVFQGVSPKSNGNPAQDRSGQSEDITPGTDDRGWVSQAMIDDIYEPPVSTETVAFRNDDDGEWLQWAFFNDGSNTLSGGDLELFFTGRAYKLQPVTRDEVQRIMLQTALGSVEGTKLDTIFHQVGGVNDYTLGTEEPDRWKMVRENVSAFTQQFHVEEIGPPWPGMSGGGSRQSARTRPPGQSAQVSGRD